MPIYSAKYFKMLMYSSRSSAGPQISQVDECLQILLVYETKTSLRLTTALQCDIMKRNYQDINFKKDFG